MDKKYIINHTNSNFAWIYWQGTLQKRHITISILETDLCIDFVAILALSWHDEAQNSWMSWEFQKVGRHYLNAMIHEKVPKH
jgi:hypothetical protein